MSRCPTCGDNECPADKDPPITDAALQRVGHLLYREYANELNGFSTQRSKVGFRPQQVRLLKSGFIDGLDALRLYLVEHGCILGVLVLGVAMAVIPGCVIVAKPPNTYTLPEAETLAAVQCEPDASWRACLEHMRKTERKDP